MTPYARTSSALALIALSLGCSETLSPAGATTTSPTAAAATAKLDAAPCEDGQAWQDALSALPAPAVQRVEPTYLRDTCAGSALVSGTRLGILPEAAASARWGRLLECPAAHVRFAGNPASIQTSLQKGWIPEGWVDIAVERGGKDLVLTLRAESAAKNIRLFQRASAFVSAARE
jgi:hypothetical protein